MQMAERALGTGVRVTESVGKRVNKPTGKAGGIEEEAAVALPGVQQFQAVRA